MTDPDRLAVAIEIQGKSYRLLRWVADAIDGVRLPAQAVAAHPDGPEAAFDWLIHYQAVLPRDIAVGPHELRFLAYFFWTYILTSFDVVGYPGTRGAFGTHGCTCELCVRLEAAPHLRTKKLRAPDKRRALETMVNGTVSLAAQHARALDDAQARSFLLDPHLRRAMGHYAYGQSLIERLEGDSDGPSVLALWREIAWSREGSPLPGFQLDVADFTRAERTLVAAIENGSATPCTT